MSIKKYKLSWKAIAGEFLVIVIVLPFMLSGLGVITIALKPSISEGYNPINSIISIVLGGLGLTLLIFSIVLCLLPLGRAIFSYLATSDIGLEYRYWPIHKIYCTWEDVDYIYKSPLPFQGDMLKLKRADVSGFHINLDFRKGNFGVIKTLPVIPLRQFAGWENGTLEIELKNHAPHLFI